MIIHVRTTLILDDELVREAKKRAADCGLTLSELVNRSLREALDTPPPAAEATPFEMVTYGDRQPQVAHEPDELVRAADDEDAAGLGSGY
jgi:hypothetical protein